MKQLVYPSPRTNTIEEQIPCVMQVVKSIRDLDPWCEHKLHFNKKNDVVMILIFFIILIRVFYSSI
jgi:hypothetical protein